MCLGCEATDGAPQISASVLESRAPLRTSFPTYSPGTPTWPLTPLVALPYQVHPRHGCHPQHPHGRAATLLDGRAMATFPPCSLPHTRSLSPLLPRPYSHWCPPRLPLLSSLHPFGLGLPLGSGGNVQPSPPLPFTNKAGFAFALC